MIRKIIHINEELCNGCGICADACHEGAIAVIDGKARLVREDYCDGFGDCLPACPTGAITFEEREAPAYDEAAVQKAKAEKQAAQQSAEKHAHVCNGGGCPGSAMKTFQSAQAAAAKAAAARPAPTGAAQSRLSQWPVQIKLAPVHAPFYQNANLLVAADCSAYAYASFHEDFIRGRITLIGCPKLDAVDYAEKLTAILSENDIKSVTVVRMEVPCCGGIENAVKNALRASQKMIPWQVVTISCAGDIIES